MDQEVLNKAKEELERLLSIPLYDVKGGKQRGSKENEEIAKLRVIIREGEENDTIIY